MIEHHARTRIPHHMTHLFAHIGFVTMNRTHSASRLVVLKWALVNALHGIAEQLLAFVAYFVLRVMLLTAKNLDHDVESVSFTLQAALACEPHSPVFLIHDK